MRNKKQRLIGIIDIETEPFLNGRIPSVFCVDIYLMIKEKMTHNIFWGENCIELAEHFIKQLKSEYNFYWHNGGKFDSLYFSLFNRNPLFIGSRLAKVDYINKKSKFDKGITHSFIDSYIMYPLKLSTNEKLEIDYSKFEEEVRENHKEEIINYLKIDCESLYKIVLNFKSMFGDKLTISSGALERLLLTKNVDCLSPHIDRIFRSFYYGGRCEVFKEVLNETIDQNWKVYDVNSMYPFVMKNYDHPISSKFTIYENIDIKSHIIEKADFLVVECKNKGALCVKTENGLSFNIESGIFNTTGAEFRVALKYNLISDVKIHRAYVFHKKGNFAEFVDKYYKLKSESKKKYQETKNSQFKLDETFYKLILNGAYGKLAFDPEKYNKNFNFSLQFNGFLTNDNISHLENKSIFKLEDKPIKSSEKLIYKTEYNNVATAASITGYARAYLLEYIMKTKNLIYCDTDSLICEELLDDTIKNENLGGFKLEGEFTHAIVLEKKIYYLENTITEEEKKASKGVILKKEDYIDLINKSTISTFNIAPVYSAKVGSVRFITKQTTFTKNKISNLGFYLYNNYY